MNESDIKSAALNRHHQANPQKQQQGFKWTPKVLINNTKNPLSP
jgi:hypothetical protein